MNTTDSGFENGERVAITTPEELDRHGDQRAPDDLELRFDFSDEGEERIAAEVESRVAFELKAAQAEALRAVLFLLKDAENPRRTVFQLLYKCGAGSALTGKPDDDTKGGSAAVLAKRFGVSRQNWEQDSERNLVSLDLRKNGLEKQDSASKTYSKTNFRKPIIDEGKSI